MPRRPRPVPAPPPPAVNEALRAHVTSAKFVLTLGRTHIAALVWLDLWLRVGREGSLPKRQEIGPSIRRAFDFFVPGAEGLIERGLVVHVRFTGPGPYDKRPMEEAWQITDAGRAVMTLLKESGIWAEYADALPAAPAGEAAA